MDVEARARKNEQAILTNLSKSGQNRVAEKIGVHETTVSKMKERDGEIAKMANFLAVCGLQVAPVEHRLYPSQSVAALLTLSKLALNQIDSPDQMASLTDDC